MEINDLISSEMVVANLRRPVRNKSYKIYRAAPRTRRAYMSGPFSTCSWNVSDWELPVLAMGLLFPTASFRLDRLHGHFARLEQPVDFQSIDERPVDLIFLLLAPESAGADHLKRWPRFPRA